MVQDVCEGVEMTTEPSGAWWTKCPHFSLSYDGAGLCDLVPDNDEDMGLCMVEIDHDELCPEKRTK